MSKAIINPVRGKRKPIAKTAILILGHPIWYIFEKLIEQYPVTTKNIHICPCWVNDRITCAGPLIGAPFASLALEQLIALGAKKIITIGCAGSLHKDFLIGDIVIPSKAFSEEGTSSLYIPNTTQSFSSRSLSRHIMNILKENTLNSKEGVIWTTDAPYRETIEKIQSYQEKGAHGVEMETSALFTVAKFREVDISSIIVITDELFDLKWKPGFASKKFKDIGKKVISSIIDYYCYYEDNS